MIQESWWESIPPRVDLRKANFSSINSEGYALRNREIQTHDLTTETFAATYLVELFKSEHPHEKQFSDSLPYELEKRAFFDQEEKDAAFAIFGTTHEEMKLRVKRVHLNMGTLEGINNLMLRPWAPDEDYFDIHFAQDAYAKFLESLTDDEIAELAAIAEGEAVRNMPAHKEILIEAFERRGYNHVDM